MLKRLELCGFKSFADKTVFDFAPGLTAIVGPNGSGKSNIIDAVRWVLGEQSVKSLRGGEMTDVIFNGSASRKSLGMAEVVMVFDNRPMAVIRGLEEASSDKPGPLATPSAEVRITRRVYRDGEGEYLINGQPSRLKDIKDLFLGSGAGTSAYSIIEQGRVDALLQASPRDRRLIFEEAAGISRFKAKKLETLRKLEQVDRNLGQLRLVADEVEKQLRTVKLQAAKAERFQEYTHKLRDLRLQLALREYHELSQRLHEASGQLGRLREGLIESSNLAERWEKSSQEIETALGHCEGQLSGQESALNETRRAIASQQSSSAQANGLASELQADLDRCNSRRHELAARLANVSALAEQARIDVAGVAEQEQLERQHAAQLMDDLAATCAALDHLREQIEADRADHLEHRRLAARLATELSSTEHQVELLRRERDRLRSRSEQTTEQIANLDLELEGLLRAEQDLHHKRTSAWQNHADQIRQRDHWRRLAESERESLSQLRATRTGLASRIEILEGLERAFEGLSIGVREVLAEKQADGELNDLLVGLLADLLSVPREYAPLIERVLGDKAQCFLVRDPLQLDEVLRQRGKPFAGRVGFVPLSAAPISDERPLPLAVDAIRAAEVVQVSYPELAGLPEQLLGNTLIVPDLATARVLRLAETRTPFAEPQPGIRYITRAGELLEVDGTLTVGTIHAEGGILSRKSELRELLAQLAPLDERLAETAVRLREYTEKADALEEPIRALQRDIETLTDQASELRVRIAQHRTSRAGLHEDLSANRRQMSGIEAELAKLQERQAELSRESLAAEQTARDVEARLEDADRTVRQLEQKRDEQQEEGTTSRVALARTAERLAGLRQRYEQVLSNLRQLSEEAETLTRHIETTQLRLVQTQSQLLDTAQSLASLYVSKESAENAVAELIRQRDDLRLRRAELANWWQTVRGEWSARQQQAYEREVEVKQLTLRQEAISSRLLEDYQLDLAAEYAERRERLPELDSESAVSEAEELRRKLSKLGAVNLDSLTELAEVESRAKQMREQVEDVSKSQKSLQEIIDRINSESRRLFSETFANVRGHFQELFRKLFAGGMADVVLEEGDVLESGIEVVARPPGKELRSISLMSGGEKTMTAVALLLAIFRNKPSPFCLLDEVDAALDEANTARLASVLPEFLDRSHFVLITHKKRMMASMDVLYGITMQESGVSRQIAVKFDDFPDEQAAAAA